MAADSTYFVFGWNPMLLAIYGGCVEGIHPQSSQAVQKVVSFFFACTRVYLSGTRRYTYICWLVSPAGDGATRGSNSTGSSPASKSFSARSLPLSLRKPARAERDKCIIVSNHGLHSLFLYSVHGRRDLLFLLDRHSRAPH